MEHEENVIAYFDVFADELGCVVEFTMRVSLCAEFEFVLGEEFVELVREFVHADADRGSYGELRREQVCVFRVDSDPEFLGELFLFEPVPPSEQCHLYARRVAELCFLDEMLVWRVDLHAFRDSFIVLICFHGCGRRAEEQEVGLGCRVCSADGAARLRVLAASCDAAVG